MYKVRFHLGAGPHFLHWQVRHGEEVTYHKPEDVQLVLTECKLRNQPKKAQEIFDGANKDVCAWVECKTVEVKSGVQGGTYPVQYNPRRVPHWTNPAGDNLDNAEFETIISQGRSLAAQ